MLNRVRSIIQSAAVAAVCLLFLYVPWNGVNINKDRVCIGYAWIWDEPRSAPKGSEHAIAVAVPYVDWIRMLPPIFAAAALWAGVRFSRR